MSPIWVMTAGKQVLRQSEVSPSADLIAWCREGDHEWTYTRTLGANWAILPRP